MEHFSLAEWTDYVRGVHSHIDVEMMNQHLETGCTTCDGDRLLLDRVLAFARREAALEVAEAEVNRIKRLAIFHRPEDVFVGARRISELMFDSFRQPFALGVRNASHSARHLLFSGPEYSVDLQQSAVPGGSVRLMGQITRNTGTGEPASGATVTLKAGAGVLARTVTNPFGEFQLEYVPGRRFRILVGLSGR